jgi:serine/threonine protein phosphatase PrpC
VELRAGDVILVCSDGLSDEVDDRAVERTLAALADPAEACLAARTASRARADGAAGSSPD